MKYIPLALLVFAALGCRHNEFDVNSAQVTAHRAAAKPAPLKSPEEINPNTDFRKGERLPDGTVADHDVKMAISDDGKGG